MPPKKGVKIALGDFLGPAASSQSSMLPNAPKQRAEGDTGEFKRAERKDRDDQPSRSDGDWGRGGGVPSGGSRGGDDRGGGGFGGGGSDQQRSGFGGGGGGSMQSSREPRERPNDGFDLKKDREPNANGFVRPSERRQMATDRAENPEAFQQQDNNRFSSAPSSSSASSSGSGERPRMNLVKRTSPPPMAPPTVQTPAPLHTPAPRVITPKANPFGAAKAVDTNAKMAEMEKDRVERAAKQKEVDALKKIEDDKRKEAEAVIAKEEAAKKVEEERIAAVEAAEARKVQEEKEKAQKVIDDQIAEEALAAASKAAADKLEVAMSTPLTDSDGFVSATLKKDMKALKLEVNKKQMEEEDMLRQKRKSKAKEKRRGAAPVISSRAAALGDAVAPKQGFESRGGGGGGGGGSEGRVEGLRSGEGRSGGLEGRNESRAEGLVDIAPPAAPVQLRGPPAALSVNSRISGLMDDDKERTSTSRRDQHQRNNDGVLPPRDFGDNSNNNSNVPPLQVTNSRFAAVQDDQKNRMPPRDNTPLTVQNSRMSASADRSSSMAALPVGPPPVQNSRFEAAREQDRMFDNSNNINSSRNDRNDRDAPPVPMANSRWGGEEARDERRGGGGGGGDFSRRDEEAPGRTARGGAGGESWGVSKSGGLSSYNTNAPSSLSSRFSSSNNAPAVVPVKAPISIIDSFGKAKDNAVKISSVIALPGETQEEAETRVANTAALKATAETLAANAKAEAAAAEVMKVKAEEERVAKASEFEVSLLSDFSAGKMQGAELTKWCKAQGEMLPTPFKLLYAMLSTQWKGKADTTAAWAKPEQWGSALLSLIGKDEVNVQKQYLYAVQKYCLDLNFPKVNDEAVVVSLFKGMYKYDIAEAEAMLVYKEDESKEHEKGKTNVIVQANAWFMWLEEDDSDDSDSD